jgi:hypothetical protein
MGHAPGIAIVVFAASLASSHAAVVYPWCTSGAGMEFGAVNCGFNTFEQCLQTARGNGQHCQPNPLYQAPTQSKVKPHKRSRAPTVKRGD